VMETALWFTSRSHDHGTPPQESRSEDPDHGKLVLFGDLYFTYCKQVWPKKLSIRYQTQALLFGLSVSGRGE
jgi:hypothetical protein